MRRINAVLPVQEEVEGLSMEVREVRLRVIRVMRVIGVLSFNASLPLPRSRSKAGTRLALTRARGAHEEQAVFGLRARRHTHETRHEERHLRLALEQHALHAAKLGRAETHWAEDVDELVLAFHFDGAFGAHFYGAPASQVRDL
jgi:hypothetical protein